MKYFILSIFFIGMIILSWNAADNNNESYFAILGIIIFTVISIILMFISDMVRMHKENTERKPREKPTKTNIPTQSENVTKTIKIITEKESLKDKSTEKSSYSKNYDRIFRSSESSDNTSSNNAQSAITSAIISEKENETMLPLLTKKDIQLALEEIDGEWYDSYYKKVFFSNKFESLWKTYIWGEDFNEVPDIPLSQVYITTTYNFMLVFWIFERYCINNSLSFPLSNLSAVHINTSGTLSILKHFMKSDTIENLKNARESNPNLMVAIYNSIQNSIILKDMPYWLNSTPEELLDLIFPKAMLALPMLKNLFETHNLIIRNDTN